MHKEEEKGAIRVGADQLLKKRRLNYSLVSREDLPSMARQQGGVLMIEEG
jgi:hypothetical protein